MLTSTTRLSRVATVVEILCGKQGTAAARTSAATIHLLIRFLMLSWFVGFIALSSTHL
jgi:beta-lactamase class D